MWLTIAFIFIDVLTSLIQNSLKPRIAAKGPGQNQAPMADTSHPIPIVYGTSVVKGPNCVWRGPLHVQSEANNNYSYRMNMQMAICHGPAELVSVQIGNEMPVATTFVAKSGAPVLLYSGCLELTRAKYNYSTDGYPGQIAFVHICTYTKYDGLSAVDHTEYGYLVQNVGTAGGGINTNVNHGHWKRIAMPGGITGNIAVTRDTDGAVFYFNGQDWTTTPPVGLSSMATDEELAWVYYDDPTTGGIHGTISFYPGTQAQGADSQIQLEQRAGGPTPTFPGLCYAVFRDWDRKVAARAGYPFFWGFSPIIPPIAFEVKRIPDPLGLGAAATIGPPPSAFLRVRGFYNDPSLISGGFAGFFIVGTVPTGAFAAFAGQIAYYSAGSWQFQVPAVGTILVDSSTGLYYEYIGIGAWVPTLPIGADANPACIIYDLLNDTTYGLGIPSGRIDTASFIAAGTTLAAEGLGMSLVLDKQDTFDAIVADILKTIDAAFYTDPATGFFTLKLIRQDYDVTLIPAFTADDYSGSAPPRYQRSSWMDVANEVKVQYIDRNQGYAQRPVQVQDPANYQAQGELVSVQNTYNGVTTSTVATMLAQRDIQVLSQPLAKVTLTLSRKAWALRPGSVFLFSDPEIGIYSQVLRVLKIAYGTIDALEITVDCTEDVFGLPNTVFVAPSSTWTDPSRVPPTAPAPVALWEPPYPVLSDLGPGEQRAVMALAARADYTTTGLEIFTADDAGTLTATGRLLEAVNSGFTPTALLQSSVALEERTPTIVVQGVVDFDPAFVDPATGLANLLIVDDEVMQFDTAADNGDGTWTIRNLLRGTLDTIPAAHAISARVWWLQAYNAVSGSSMASDRSVTAAVTGSNSTGNSDPYDAPQETLTTTSRQQRPFVPGAFRVGAATDLPSSFLDVVVAGDTPISWATRNKVAQGATIVAQDAAPIAPDVGQNSRLTLTKGMAEVFNPFTPSGAPFPIGVAQVIGAVSSPPSDWLLLGVPAGGQKYLGGSSGFITYGFAYGAGSAGTTYWISVELGFAFIHMDPFLPGPFRVPLFKVVFTAAGANLQATLTDLRETPVVGVVLDDPTATAGALTGAAIQATGRTALSPNRVSLDSHVGAVSSRAQRVSGMIYEAGYGLGYGLHYGGN